MAFVLLFTEKKIIVNVINALVNIILCIYNFKINVIIYSPPTFGPLCISKCRKHFEIILAKFHMQLKRNENYFINKK